jgi:hypothetical protein
MVIDLIKIGHHRELSSNDSGGFIHPTGKVPGSIANPQSATWKIVILIESNARA